MLEKKVFFADQMHQYHVSQWEEHNCGAHNEKNGDY